MKADGVRLQWNRLPEEPSAGNARLVRVSAGAPELRLIEGDNLLTLRTLQDDLRGAVALAYLDPPFLTERKHKSVERTRSTSGAIVRQARDAFDDRWGGVGPYLDALGPRLAAVRDTLRPDGSVVVHIDSKTSHYVKVLCDEIFGPECFASEIIWRYRRWPAKTPNFQRVHDVLLRYVRDAASPPRFNQLYEPLAPSTQKTWGTGKQRAVVGKDGRRLRSSTTSAPSPGVPLGDVWEIGILAPVAKERTGYPTQKPRALLERLLSGLTQPGDLVLDPYAGSGTTLAVAHDLGRSALGIDSGAEALRVIQERLASAGAELTVDRLQPASKRLDRKSPTREQLAS